MGMLSGMQKNNLKMEKCVVSKPYNPEEKCEQLVENIKLLCKERQFRIMHWHRRQIYQHRPFTL